MEHKVVAIASGKFGIQQLVLNVDLGEYSEISGETLRSALMSRVLRAGYTSVLGVKSVDDIDEAALIFRGSVLGFPEFCKSVVHKLEQNACCVKELNTLSDEYAERKAFLTKVIDGNVAYIRNSYEALALCGIDVTDTESKRRVLGNLGFERV